MRKFTFVVVPGIEKVSEHFAIIKTLACQTLIIYQSAFVTSITCLI